MRIMIAPCMLPRDQLEVSAKNTTSLRCLALPSSIRSNFTDCTLNSGRCATDRTSNRVGMRVDCRAIGSDHMGSLPALHVSTPLLILMSTLRAEPWLRVTIICTHAK
jgi:hypothetical protein